MRRMITLMLGLGLSAGLTILGAQQPGAAPGPQREQGGPPRWAVRGGAMRHRMGGRMDPAQAVLSHRAVLQLDSSQVGSLTALQARFRAQVQAQRVHMDSMRMSMAVPPERRTPAQQAAVRAQRRAMADAMVAIGEQRDAYALAVHNTLTEAQRARMAAIREDARRGMASRGGGRMRMRGPRGAPGHPPA